jgi:hypothetical protein
VRGEGNIEDKAGRDGRVFQGHPLAASEVGEEGSEEIVAGEIDL